MSVSPIQGDCKVWLPSLRRLFVYSLILSTFGMVAVTCWLSWPVLRENSIQRALRDSDGPWFWWPSGWREEYTTVQNLLDATNDDKKISNFPGALKAVKKGQLDLKAVPGLVKAMQSSSGNARTMAAQALANLDVSEQAEIVLPALLDSLSSPLGARGNIVIAIANLGSKARPAIPRLIDLLDTDPDASTRSNAAAALTRIGLDDSAVRVSLRNALEDKYAGVRWNAAIGICRAEPNAREPLPVLISAIREGGWKRPVAAELLEKIDPDLFSETMQELATNERWASIYPTNNPIVY